MWPWSRQRRDIEKAHEGLEKAATEALQAEERRRRAERLVRQSSAVSARLRREVDLNGFTDLFLEAMGRRS